jgi:hypothetical protein
MYIIYYYIIYYIIILYNMYHWLRIITDPPGKSQKNYQR